MTQKPTYEELAERIRILEKSESDLRKANKSLIENESRFKLLYERAPLAYQSLDCHGNFLEVNPSWLKILGYNRDEVIGKSFGEFLKPEFKEHFNTNFPRFKTIGEILGVEFEMVKKDGSSILVSFHGKIGKDMDGNFQQTHCIFHDITRDKKIEEEREKLIDELREAINNVKTLSGLLPICSKCKKIRDDEGYWKELEQYIESHSDLFFSHGLCPSCLDDLYGKKEWFQKYKKKKEKGL